MKAPSTVFFLLVTGLTVSLLISLTYGRSGFDFSWYLDTRVSADIKETIFWQLRVPRTFLVAIVGGALGLSGAVLQGWLRNPLADPGVLGVSASAALGAVCILYFGLNMAAWLVPLAGIVGALIGFVLLLTMVGRGTGILLLILAGAALNALAASLTALALNLAPNPFAVQDMLFWLMGSFENRSLTHLWMLLPPVLMGGALLMRTAPALDALALGERTAVSLGVSERALLWQIGLGVALAVGASVAVAGTIGFVGLVVPHLLRPLFGWEPRRLLLPSTIAGATLLVLADILVRSMPPGPELRIGVLTALLGAPFFFWLLRHIRRGEEIV